MWELAASEGLELLTLGDFNLNRLAWDKNPDKMDPYEKAQNPMVIELKEIILSKGFTVLNNSPTRPREYIHSNSWSHFSHLNILLS